MLLDSIVSNIDIKKFDTDKLYRLSKEIRKKIVSVVSKNGGHLSSNLGVVELTIALHKVFNLEKDKIVFDVGHQCYAHKLLTGRNKNFNSLRKHNGISGFPSRKESRHDAFGTGHSSTSISAALGMAIARDIKRGQEKIIALIGDGALTAGLAFEALNYAGYLKKDLIILLNDNGQSISKNVGALSNYLTKTKISKTYQSLKKEVASATKKMPLVGPSLFAAEKKIKKVIKQIAMPKEGLLFDQLGFSYYGPIDGHKIESLIEHLEAVKKTKGPQIVHVITEKGKGYEFAETNSEKFHGIAPFNNKNGEIKVSSNGSVSYNKVFSDTLVELASVDNSIIAITAAMTDGTGLTEFKKRFPKRFFDVGIAEQNAVTLAAGMASRGLKPVVAIYSTFLQRAYDQIVHDVCLQNLPVVFAINRGGLVGDDGPTHHGVFDFAYLRHIPNIVVMAPKDENELQHMFKTAVEYDGPISFRFPRGNGEGVTLDKALKEFVIGKAEIINKENEGVLLLAIGSLVGLATQTADKLVAEGIPASVVNARFVKPLDEDLFVKLAKEYQLVISLEENSQLGGFGSAVLELFSRNNVLKKVITLGIPDLFIEHGSSSILLEKYGLDLEKIVTLIKAEQLPEKDIVYEQAIRNFV